VGALPGAPA
jgi:hypothetical protein